MVVLAVITSCVVVVCGWLGAEVWLMSRKARKASVRVVVVHVVTAPPKGEPAWLASQVAESKRAGLPAWMR
jgi:hypothetical protein